VKGLGEMLASDVDMFGGPCDLAGLLDFFASFPEVHWEVTSEYTPVLGDADTVGFAYTRTWRGPDGQRLAADAAEEITFRGGRVARIAYTRGPSEPRLA